MELMATQNENQAYGNIVSRKPVDLSLEEKVFKVDNEDKIRGGKKIDMVVKGLGMPAEKFTPQGLPSVD